MERQRDLSALHELYYKEVYYKEVYYKEVYYKEVCQEQERLPGQGPACTSTCGHQGG